MPERIDTPFELLGWSLTFALAIVILALGIGIAVVAFRSMLQSGKKEKDSE